MALSIRRVVVATWRGERSTIEELAVGAFTPGRIRDWFRASAEPAATSRPTPGHPYRDLPWTPPIGVSR